MDKTKYVRKTGRIPYDIYETFEWLMGDVGASFEEAIWMLIEQANDCGELPTAYWCIYDSEKIDKFFAKDKQKSKKHKNWKDISCNEQK